VKQSNLIRAALVVLVTGGAAACLFADDKPDRGATIAAARDEAGFQPLFDGKSLNNWEGREGFWRVEDGCIVGQTKEKFGGPNTFLVYKGEAPSDFVILDAVAFHVDVAFCAAYCCIHGFVGSGAIKQQRHLVARHKGAFRDFLYLREVFVKDICFRTTVFARQRALALLNGKRAACSFYAHFWTRLLSSVGDRERTTPDQQDRIHSCYKLPPCNGSFLQA